MIADRGLGDGQRNAPALHLRVGHAERPDVFSATHLAPGEIFGVVHDPHTVRFTVPYPEFNVVRRMVGHAKTYRKQEAGGRKQGRNETAADSCLLSPLSIRLSACFRRPASFSPMYTWA